MTESSTPAGAEGPTRRLAEWASELQLANIPKGVQGRAKHLILDGFGCALIGAQLPWSRTAVKSVLAFEGTGDHIVIGWDTTTSAPAAGPPSSTSPQTPARITGIIRATLVRTHREHKYLAQIL